MVNRLARAQGCLVGQLSGDALGSLVEFQHPEQIAARYPAGVREMKDGGTWNTIAGQPTDDSELALDLARTIVANGGFDQGAVREAYQGWYRSDPFDIGGTISAGLSGVPNYDSQANGGLMRVSPLGVYAWNLDRDLAARCAREDAWITHPNEVTQDANVVFALTIADTIRDGLDRPSAFQRALDIVNEHGLHDDIRETVTAAADGLPETFTRHQGWVRLALQNALYQLLHAETIEDALADTIGHGGDTDTNAAICGALYGATSGVDSIPDVWLDTLRNCRPETGSPRVRQPRPQRYWPVDVEHLASQLFDAGDQPV
jgi:ADP-ribosyl-[dinitrogen reductase] hydrolase